MIRHKTLIVLLGLALPVAAEQTVTSSAPVTSPAVAPSTTTLPTVAASTPAVVPAPAAVAPVASAAAHSGYNEITGTVMSISNDPRSIRLTVDGGYSIDFDWDKSTAVSGLGHAQAVSDLSYGDRVVVRYSGRELQALEIERLTQATPAAPRAPVPDETPPPEAPLPPLQ